MRKRLEAMPVAGRAVGGVGAYEREKAEKMEKLSKPLAGLPPAEIQGPLPKNQLPMMTI